MLIIDSKEKKKRDAAAEIAHKTWESKSAVNADYHDTVEQEYQRALSKMNAQENKPTKWKKHGKSLPKGVK